MTELTVSEEQVLAFRARRGGLLGGGAADAVAAARAVIGTQAQQEKSGILGVSARVVGRPDARAVQSAMFDAPRNLVRTWGQRDTLHIYDLATWPLVVAARSQWSSGGRRGSMPSKELEDDVRDAVDAMGRPVCRDDLLGLVPETWAEELRPLAEYARMDSIRFGAGRLLWRLAQRGDVCAASKRGQLQFYAPRKVWFPDLEWPELDAEEAARALAMRYLGVYGPATAKDVAHFFKAKVTRVRGWLAPLIEGGELMDVGCGGRKALLARREDAGALSEAPPEDWPVRLLPLYDTMLMGHADKSWTVVDGGERKDIWRKAAYVAATVIARGRIVATWTMKERKSYVDLEVLPLGGWKARMLAGVEAEAQQIATHLGIAEARVRVLD